MLTDNQKYFTCKIVKYRETGDLINVSQDRAHDVGLQSNLISTTIMQMRLEEALNWEWENYIT